ncbi:MTH1187 family thiamine-binding protein [Pyrococcus abyssi]|uniref:Thiamine-binding protein domain-containing protein n=1 Tax=Pyrococcus abyssi (strain GE5 / Orsay) TaxID=272844 RepID=Q9UY26_PYRAB|nr:MTH1187 family thiamine-binding protein [Pyrococcus abyssi]CAB50586.1 Hypothetical protein PAB1240 [Pyrococcus abyssi GE5]CCE71150.1 TPA: hypothetical protein PAB1240 [Pyrococcus abyssi GE5]
MSVIIEFSIVPLGEVSVSKYVAKVIDLLRERGIKYQLTPMGTIIEVKSLGEGLEIIREAHELMFTFGFKRVLTTIRIDERRDKERSMEDKVKSVLEKLEVEA